MITLVGFAVVIGSVLGGFMMAGGNPAALMQPSELVVILGTAVGVLQQVADALPGIGIVAAVLGIVVTMGAIAGPIEEIGHHVGAALTGTFMGVLFAYGFLGPLSTTLEHVNSAEARYYHFIK